VKFRGEDVNIVAPANFGRGAVLAPVKQDQIGPAAGLQEMGFNVAGYNCSVLVCGHDRRIAFIVLCLVA
jgi:hypothetical protein